MRSDSQNTHDSVLIRHLRQALQLLPDPQQDVTEGLRSVRAFLTGHTGDKPTEALKGLDAMERNAVPVASLCMSESEVLHRVWNAADTVEKKEMVLERLAECSEEQSCASGRVARVVDALSVFDERVRLKPEWALKREWLDKAALESQTYTGSQPLKDHLRTIFTKEYVDKGLCTGAMLDNELRSWGEL